MGRIIAKRVKGMNWMAKISLVLIFTLVFSTFMYQGWQNPKKAEAAVAFDASSESHTGTTISTSQSSFSWTHTPAGTPRGVLVYVFTRSATDMVSSVTYGGTAMTRVSGGAAMDTAGEPGRVDTFFLGSSVPTGAQTVVVNRTNNTTGMYATAATVAGAYDTEPTGIVLLQENGTYTVQSVNDGSPGSNSVRFAGGYSGGSAALAAGTGSTALQSVIAATTCSMNLVRETTAGQGARNVGFNYATSDDRAAVHLAVREIIPTLTVGEGTNPSNANAPRSTTYNALDGFTMKMNGGSGTVTSLTVTGSANFTSTNIPPNGVKVWRDAGTVGVWDGADTLISTASTAISGNATTVTISNEPVTTTSVNYLVTVDMTATATLAQTFTGTISGAAGTGLGTPVDSDANSATLTVSAVQNLTIGNGTNPGNANIVTPSTDSALDSFTLALSAGSGAINTLTFTGSANFTAANISGIKVYRDNGTVGTFDGADILVPSSYSLPGSVAAIILTTPEPVTATTVNYLVLVDFSSNGNDGSFTGTITGASGTRLSAVTSNDSSSATLTTKHDSSIASCGRCHAYPPLDGTRDGATGAVVGSHQAGGHQVACSTCHVAPATQTSADFAHRDGNITMQASISGGSYSKISPFAQVNNPTTGTCSNVSCHGGNNPTPQWGVGTVGCTGCHSGTITRTKGVPGGTLSPVATSGPGQEFGLAWGHRNAARTAANGAVAASDCIVCHLEGNYTTQKTSAYHADGNIDLRDPDGTGETPITDNSGNPFTFTKFSISYAAGSRTTAVSNSIADVITQKFCIACHDSDGAANPTARSNNGGIGTQWMPFGGINLGSNYTAANGSAAGTGAPASGALVDVKTEFATTNSSYHPVLGPLNKDYPIATRLAAPYNNIGTTPTARADGSHNKTLSVVLNCFDCHTTGTTLLDRTIVAHGNAATLRGTIYVSGPTLCTACHVGYNSSPGTTSSHGAGSAGQWGGNNGESATTMCAYCHSSTGTNTRPARPRPAQDYHGFNSLVGGGLWPTVNSRPYGFIRAWTGTAYHRPYRATEFTTGSATCGAGTCPGNGSVGDGGTRTYTPGGSY